MQPDGEPTEAPNTAGMRAYADELQQTFRRMQEEAPALQRQARAIQVTETSRDGLITVTVGARGELVRLDIDPRIYRRPDARALADAITDTIHKAGTTARERVVETFEPLIPAEQMKAHLSGDLDAVMEQMAGRMLGGR